VDGFIYPGHASAIIGAEPYSFVARDFHIPGAIAGFEPGDILLAIRSILEQAVEGTPRVALEYSRAIGNEGNSVARALMAEIFEPFDACWRGLGVIPVSGLRFRSEFSGFDAARRFGLDIEDTGRDLAGCRCGEVLRGVIRPEACRLFGKKCNPDSPFGPCMVSYEGACLIHFKYGPEKGAAREQDQPGARQRRPADADFIAGTIVVVRDPLLGELATPSNCRADRLHTDSRVVDPLLPGATSAPGRQRDGQHPSFRARSRGSCSP
jgi:hypothetical protein